MGDAIRFSTEKPSLWVRWRIKTLGAPTQSDIKELVNSMKTRFKGNPEGLSEYARSVIDRQVSKASGLLSVDALLLGALTLASSGKESVLADHPALIKWCCVLLLTSAMLCFHTLLVAWGPSAKFTTGLVDGESSLARSAARTWTLNLASLLGCLVVVMCLFAFLLPLYGVPDWPDLQRVVADYYIAPSIFGVGFLLSLVSWYLQQR